MARIHVLREISENSLDPKVAYVKSKSGKLIPKKSVNSKVSKKVSATEAVETLEEAPELTTTEEENSAAVTEEVKPKKKFPPPKKKKSTDVENS